MSFTTFDLLKIKNISDFEFRLLFFIFKESFHKNGVIKLTPEQIILGCDLKICEDRAKRKVSIAVKKVEKMNLIKVERDKSRLDKYTFLKIKEENTNVKVLTFPNKNLAQTYDRWIEELAKKWLNWQVEENVEDSFPLEEYKYHIYEASKILPVEDKMKQFWMEKIFDFIKTSDFFGNQGACSRPILFLTKMKGIPKIIVIYRQISTNKKEKMKIISTVLEKKEIASFF